MTAPKPQVAYQTAYFWTCPSCSSLWQLRRRPRTGTVLTCKPLTEQRLAEYAATTTGEPWKGCDAQVVSTGRREGVAPNLYL